MKLLKLKIGDMPKEKQFRSLYPGFEIEFHTFDDKGLKAMESFSPFCFAGLNGSGKSNVLEALSAIFFHLECCVAKFKPDTFERYFRRNECMPDAYSLEYLIGQHNSKPYALAYFDKIVITKKVGEAPIMMRQAFPFSKDVEVYPVSLEPRFDTTFPEAAEGKLYLPQIIVGYSSGENEILSLPFRKSRLLNFDKYREDYLKGYRFEEPENSLIYIDAQMSQAVLLACLLYEDEETLKPLRKELQIIGLRSFRMNIKLSPSFDSVSKKQYILSDHINDKLEELKKCATTWNVFTETINGEHGATYKSTLILDFFIDDEVHTKTVFKKFFTTSFELFRFLQVLYELNAISVLESTKEDVYGSKGVYTDWKIPTEIPENNVFYFEDFYILKEINGDPKQLLLREFSDGEHQFLHTMGICLMLKERKSILLLDEPETHFNPSWRAKFIKMLGDSIKAGNNKDYVNGRFNVHYLKDILLTSHSPFIISDCMPDNVIFFKREPETKLLEAKKASQMGLNTYGSSVDYILKNFFKTDLISNKSFGELKEIIDHGTIDELRKAVEDFGESSEKQFLFKKIYEKMKNRDDN